MKTFVAILLLGLIATCCAASRNRHSGQGDAAGRALLRKQLFSDYDPVNIPDDVTVKFGMAILALDADEERGVLNIGTWMKYMWRDDRLAWDNETNHINLLRLSSSEIWKPDITVYNSAQLTKNMMNCWDSNVILYSNGNIIWVPPCQIQTYCNFTLDKHPYGEQSCDLKVGSWTYDANILNIDFYGEKQADLTDFGNQEWKITGNTAVRNEKYYPCCPEPYTDITYTLKFQRKEATAGTCKA